MQNKTSKKILLNLLRQHKKTLAIFTVISMLLASIYAYMQENLYASSSTIYIEKQKKDLKSLDILDNIINNNTLSIQAEVETLKSQALIKKMLPNIYFKSRFYEHNILLDKELGDKSPFTVDLLQGEDIFFYITPVKNNNYLLEASGIDPKTLKKWSINKNYVYNIPVEEKHIMFTLHLKHPSLLKENTKYKFIVLGQKTSIENIQKNLYISTEGEYSSVIKVKYIDTLPSRCQEVNNALIDTYLAQDTERKIQESSRTLSFIDKQLSGIDGNIKNLDKLEKTDTLPHATLSHSKLLEKINTDKELLDNLTNKNNALKLLRKQIKKGGIATAAGLELSGTGIVRLLEKLQESRGKRKRLRVDFTSAHPAVVAQTKHIAQIRKNLYGTIDTMRFRIGKRKARIQKRIDTYKKEIKSLPKKEKLYGDLKRKFVVNESIYTYFLEKRATTAIVKASVVNQNRIIDNANIPEYPIAPNRKMIILIGTLLGLLLGIIFILSKEYIDDTIKDEKYLIENSPLPLIGNIPYIKDDYNNIKIFESPKSIVAEAFRALRTNLQFLSKHNDNLIVSLTSTIGGEGKTTISSNLAGIISLTGKKVIILNMDMRKPTLHTKFSLGNTQGMSTLLSGSTPLKEVIQKTPYDNIHVITSGPIPPNPSELIEEGNMPYVLDALKAVYDVIILDTPPVGLVTDAMYLMKLSDISLYILRAKYSKKSFLDEVHHMHREHQIKGLSLLLNGIQTQKNGYGYYEEGK